MSRRSAVPTDQSATAGRDQFWGILRHWGRSTWVPGVSFERRQYFRHVTLVEKAIGALHWSNGSR